MDINTEISDMRVALASLEAKAKTLKKPKQWEPRGGDIVQYRTYATSVAAACAMNTQSRLLAYVYEFGGSWKADWEDWKQEKCFVYFGNHEISQTWKWSITYNNCTAGAVYMSIKCAEALAAKLNSGEVVL